MNMFSELQIHLRLKSVLILLETGSFTVKLRMNLKLLLCFRIISAIVTSA